MIALPTTAISTAGMMIIHLRRRAACNVVSKEYCLPGITGRPLSDVHRDPRRDPDRHGLPVQGRQGSDRRRRLRQFVIKIRVLDKQADAARERVAQLRGGDADRETLWAGIKPDAAAAAIDQQDELG